MIDDDTEDGRQTDRQTIDDNTKTILDRQTDDGDADI